MKRLDVILLLVFAAVVILSNGRTPGITDKSIVHAIGVDKGGEGMSVTLQIFKPEAAGADTPVDISKANFKTLTAEGKDMADCLHKLTGKAGGELFLGHMQLLVIGEGVRFSDIGDLVSPLRDDKSIYSGLYLACAENARDIVSFPIKENAVTAENYRRIIENAAAHGGTFNARLIDVDNCLSVCGSLAMPYLELSGSKESRCLEVMGSRILSRQGFYDDILTAKDCSLLTLLCDSSAPRTVTIDGTQLHLSRVSRSISFEQREGLVCHIALTLTPQGNGQDLECLSKPLSAELSKLLESCSLKDPARLFEQLRLKNPTLFSKYRNNLGELYESMRFEVEIK